MRISDWSSDVCSSDLPAGAKGGCGRMSEFAGKRAVVTGGAGFIGSHLVDALLEAGCARVAVVDNLFLGKPENIGDAEASGDRFVLYRSEEHTSELQSLMRISYAVFCLKKKTNDTTQDNKEI